MATFLRTFRWALQTTRSIVRGSEAGGEALEYHRKSMNKLSKVDLESALGKLLKKKSNTKDPLAFEKINGYTCILQIRRKLNKY